MNTRISIPDASGRAGAFVLVNIRINIPNASGGAMAGVVHSGEYPYRYTERPGRLQGIKKSPEPLETPGVAGISALGELRRAAGGLEAVLKFFDCRFSLILRAFPAFHCSVILCGNHEK